MSEVTQGVRDMMAEACEGGARSIEKYARMICPEHGEIYLSRSEYDQQMCNADRGWLCTEMCTEPVEMIGPCGAECDFDDIYIELPLAEVAS
jgi:hypothetical protein